VAGGRPRRWRRLAAEVEYDVAAAVGTVARPDDRRVLAAVAASGAAEVGHASESAATLAAIALQRAMSGLAGWRTGRWNGSPARGKAIAPAPRRAVAVPRGWRQCTTLREGGVCGFRLGGTLARIPQSGYARLVVQPLAVERTQADGYELLAAAGEIDIATSPRLIAALNEAVTDSTGSLVVDLSRVGFMDSTGLALLVRAQRRMRRRGRGFAVVCPEGPVRRIFEITDMIGILRVRTSRETALTAAGA
jgi:anti-sigma B factor antagonist